MIVILVKFPRPLYVMSWEAEIANQRVLLILGHKSMKHKICKTCWMTRKMTFRLTFSRSGLHLDIPVAINRGLAVKFKSKQETHFLPFHISLAYILFVRFFYCLLCMISGLLYHCILKWVAHKIRPDGSKETAKKFFNVRS